MSVCVCYHLISETIQFHYPDELSMDGTGCERSELQRFCCKNVSFRRYGSFNGFVVLRHLELLTSTEKAKKLTMLFHSQNH